MSFSVVAELYSHHHNQFYIIFIILDPLKPLAMTHQTFTLTSPRQLQLLVYVLPEDLPIWDTSPK